MVYKLHCFTICHEQPLSMKAALRVPALRVAGSSWGSGSAWRRTGLRWQGWAGAAGAPNKGQAAARLQH